MKVFKKLVLITALILVTCINVSFANQTGEVNTSGIRIRKEANTTSDILTVIYKGDDVKILEESGEWYKITASGKTGYVKKEFITVDKTTTTAKNNTTNTNSSNTNTVKNTNTNKVNTTNTATNTVDNATSSDNNQIASLDGALVTNSEVNVRVLPNMTSRVITRFAAEKALIKTGEMNNWIQVTDGTTNGWVPKSKIKGNDTPVTDATINPDTLDNTIKDTNTNVVNNTTNTNNNTNTNTNKTNTSSVKNETTNTVADKTTTSKETAVNKIGIVNVETAKVRSTASTKGKVVGFLDLDDKITITAEDGEWYKFTASDVSGYVNKKLVTIKSENVSSRGDTSEREDYVDTTVVDNKENEKVTTALDASTSTIVDFSKQYLGYPYIVAGKSPETGFDCSGFTRYVYSKYGYSLGSTTASQQNAGTEVNRNDMLPGDLIVFYNEEMTKVGHVGIYIGDGNFVHAANPERGVVIDNIDTNTYYNTRFITVRRIMN